MKFNKGVDMKKNEVGLAYVMKTEQKTTGLKNASLSGLFEAKYILMLLSIVVGIQLTAASPAAGNLPGVKDKQKSVVSYQKEVKPIEAIYLSEFYKNKKFKVYPLSSFQASTIDRINAFKKEYNKIGKGLKRGEFESRSEFEGKINRKKREFREKSSNLFDKVYTN